MIIFNRRTMIIFLIMIVLFLLISILYKISLDNKRKFIITIVDYRWNPIKNIAVRFETTDKSYEEYYTNNHGQIRFYLENNLNTNEYIQISTGQINEKILFLYEDVTIRINTINQNTGEIYDDHFLGE